MYKARPACGGRYRQLGVAVRGSLVDLERALKGLAAMSTDLEAMSVSLLTDQVMSAAFPLFRANLLAPVQAKLLTRA